MSHSLIPQCLDFSYIRESANQEGFICSSQEECHKITDFLLGAQLVESVVVKIIGEKEFLITNGSQNLAQKIPLASRKVEFQATQLDENRWAFPSYEKALWFLKYAPSNGCSFSLKEGINNYVVSFHAASSLAND
ncbi:MAG: hypothetical protein WCP39_07405 [Chlamydiota bacterium]